MAHPGDIETRTGGYIYDRRLVAELTDLGVSVETLSLGAGYPFATERSLDHALALLAALPAGATIIVDGLAFGTFGQRARELADSHDLIALVHHPLAFETGLTTSDAERLRRSETRALAAARRVITTSHSTAATLTAEFEVEASKIIVAVPGTDPKPLAGGGTSPQLTVLSVGSVVPRKNMPQLVRALAMSRDLPWRLRVVGSLERSRAETSALHQAITDGGVEDRVELMGELDPESVDSAYAAADLYVSASVYEGYGMALLDAVAFGLPIVAARGGAVGEVLPLDAALLVPPGDDEALATILRQVLSDADLRAGLRSGAIGARSALPRWRDTAHAVLAAIRS